MVASGSAATGAADTQSAPAGGVVPFFYGSNLFAQKFGTVDATQLGADAADFEYNVIPGGFLRGVRLQARASGGTIGAGVVAPDAPWSMYSSVKLENVDGSEIIKPMGGYAHYAAQRYFRPWWGDPAKRWDYSGTGSNPQGTLLVAPEIRHTAGVLANTDARSQYRIVYTLAPGSKVFSTAPTTYPTIAVTKYAEIWAQPDSADANGNTITPLPPGLCMSTLRRHQVLTLNGAGADNTLQLSLTGNELRGAILVVRDSNNARQDYLSDPVRWNIDSRNLGVFSPDEIYDHMNDFYEGMQDGNTRPTGVYVFPRFFDPGRMVGQSWLATTNATYLTWETATSATAVNVPGTVEIITDEVVPLGDIPAELESI